MKLRPEEIHTLTTEGLETQHLTLATESDGGRSLVQLLVGSLYANPVTASLRELITNALDAHLEVGSEERVKIELPSVGDPRVVIRDYGPGMSPERIKEVYLKFGSSTKRDGDIQHGAYGIGSKSMLAVATQGLIRSFHNGIVRHYCLYVDETGHQKLTTLLETETDEPSGLEVSYSIPSSLVAPARLFIYGSTFYQREKFILEDIYCDADSYRPSQFVTPLEYKKTHVSDAHELWVRKVTSSTIHTPSLRLVLAHGNVYYNLTRNVYTDVLEYLRSTGFSFPSSPGWDICTTSADDWEILTHQSACYSHLVLKLPIGSIDLTTSREDVRQSKRSTEAIATALTKAYSEIQNTNLNLLQNLPTFQHLYRSCLDAANTAFVNRFYFQGNHFQLTNTSTSLLPGNSLSFKMEVPEDYTNIIYLDPKYRAITEDDKAQLKPRYSRKTVPLLELINHHLYYIIHRSPLYFPLNRRELHKLLKRSKKVPMDGKKAYVVIVDSQSVDGVDLTDSVWTDLTQDYHEFREYTEQLEEKKRANPTKKSIRLTAREIAIESRDGMTLFNFGEPAKLNLKDSGYYCTYTEFKDSSHRSLMRNIPLELDVLSVPVVDGSLRVKEGATVSDAERLSLLAPLAEGFIAATPTSASTLRSLDNWTSYKSLLKQLRQEIEDNHPIIAFVAGDYVTSHYILMRGSEQHKLFLKYPHFFDTRVVDYLLDENSNWLARIYGALRPFKTDKSQRESDKFGSIYTEMSQLSKHHLADDDRLLYAVSPKYWKYLLWITEAHFEWQKHTATLDVLYKSLTNT